MGTGRLAILHWIQGMFQAALTSAEGKGKLFPLTLGESLQSQWGCSDLRHLKRWSKSEQPETDLVWTALGQT